MEFILEHWQIFAVIIVFVAGGISAVVHFFKLSPAEKYKKIQGWLLQAVIWAESEYGGGTGKLKLSEVYARFCEVMPWLAKVIKYDVFCEYVDDALEEMEHLIKSNQNIAAITEGTK